MIKQMSIFILVAMLAGCISGKTEQYCPFITIKREDARLIQKVNYQDDFEVEFKGVEAYCYYDSLVKQEKAVITPIFIVKKLRDTDETDIHFSWFTNTIKGPPAYLGKKSYFTEVSMPRGTREKEYRGKAVSVKIPQEMMYDFEIFAGLAVSPQEKKYNQRIFDVDFDYYEEKFATEPYEEKLNVSPALYYEDGTRAETSGTLPNQKKNNCSSCGV